MAPSENEFDIPGIRSFWNTFKHTIIHIMSMARGEETEQGIENLLKNN